MNLENLAFENFTFYSVAEVALKLRVSRMTVYRLCQNGSLACTRIGRSYRIEAHDLTAYLTAYLTDSKRT